MRKSLLVLTCLAALVAAFSGCKTQTADLPAGVVARINGYDVTVDEFRAFCEGKIPENPATKKEKLSLIVDLKLATALATKEGLISDPEVISKVLQDRNERLAEMMREKVADETKLEEGDVPEPDVEPGPVVELYQIVTADAETAEKARADIAKGMKFEEAAGKYSTGISGKGGGYLGEVYLPGSVYPFGVRALINKLKPGEVSPVVKFDLGYSVFMIKGKKTEEQFMEQQRAKLAEETLRAKKEKAVNDLVRKLRAKSRVEYNEDFFSGKDLRAWVARVDGQELVVDPESLSSPDPFHQPHGGLGPDELRVTVDRRINDMLLAAEAQRMGMHMTPAFLLDSRVIEERVLANTYVQRKLWTESKPTEEDVRRYYEEHKKEFDRPAKARIARILVYTPKEAEKLLERVNKGEDFSSLAYKHSQDKSAASGGDMGHVFDGQTIEPVNSIVFKKLKEGEHSGVLKTKYGYEIVKVLELKAGGIAPFDDVRPRVERKAAMDARSRKVAGFYKEIREAADVQVNSELVDKLKD